MGPHTVDLWKGVVSSEGEDSHETVFGFVVLDQGEDVETYLLLDLSLLNLEWGHKGYFDRPGDGLLISILLCD